MKSLKNIFLKFFPSPSAQSLKSNAFSWGNIPYRYFSFFFLNVTQHFLNLTYLNLVPIMKNNGDNYLQLNFQGDSLSIIVISAWVSS